MVLNHRPEILMIITVTGLIAWFFGILGCKLIIAERDPSTRKLLFRSIIGITYTFLLLALFSLSKYILSLDFVLN